MFLVVSQACEPLTRKRALSPLQGATIGSGVLGLTYASRKAGWPVLLTWLLVAGFLPVAAGSGEMKDSA